MVAISTINPINSTLISVIVPIYNSEKYLDQSIRSILVQTYSNLEILLIDDGSSDESASICDSFAIHDSRIHVYHLKNEGAAYARNKGLQLATGEWVMFVDADDWLEPNAIMALYSELNIASDDLAIGNYGRFWDGEKNDFFTRTIPCDKSKPSLSGPKELATLFFNPSTSLHGVSVWGKLYRNSLIKQHNITFPVNINYEEDCCFNLQFYRYVHSAALCREVVYHYRQTNVSLSRGFRSDMFCGLVNGYRERSKFITEIGIAHQQPFLDAIFLIVIRDTLAKVINSKLSLFKKRNACKSIMLTPEVQNLSQKHSFTTSTYDFLLLKMCHIHSTLGLFFLTWVRVKTKKLRKSFQRQ